ncbi:hypothetical protein HDU96_009535 [Phlyctochytrium bullatum]|nr:hypothetical protein HDU96_009535 [Phlyctochytrium bullatum]
MSSTAAVNPTFECDTFICQSLLKDNGAVINYWIPLIVIQISYFVVRLVLELVLVITARFYVSIHGNGDEDKASAADAFKCHASLNTDKAVQGDTVFGSFVGEVGVQLYSLRLNLGHPDDALFWAFGLSTAELTGIPARALGRVSALLALGVDVALNFYVPSATEKWRAAIQARINTKAFDKLVYVLGYVVVITLVWQVSARSWLLLARLRQGNMAMRFMAKLLGFVKFVTYGIASILLMPLYLIVWVYRTGNLGKSLKATVSAISNATAASYLLMGFVGQDRQNAKHMDEDASRYGCSATNWWVLKEKRPVFGIAGLEHVPGEAQRGDRAFESWQKRAAAALRATHHMLATGVLDCAAARRIWGLVARQLWVKRVERVGLKFVKSEEVVDEKKLNAYRAMLGDGLLQDAFETLAESLNVQDYEIQRQELFLFAMALMEFRLTWYREERYFSRNECNDYDDFIISTAGMYLDPYYIQIGEFVGGKEKRD